MLFRNAIYHQTNRISNVRCGARLCGRETRTRLDIYLIFSSRETQALWWTLEGVGLRSSVEMTAVDTVQLSRLAGGLTGARWFS